MNSLLKSLLYVGLAGSTVACAAQAGLEEDCTDGRCDSNFDEFRTVDECFEFYGSTASSDLVGCVQTANNTLARDRDLESGGTRAEALLAYRDMDTTFSVDVIPWAVFLADDEDMENAFRLGIEVAADSMLNTPLEIDYINDSRIQSAPAACLSSYLSVLDVDGDTEHLNSVLLSLEDCTWDRIEEASLVVANVMDEIFQNRFGGGDDLTFANDTVEVSTKFRNRVWELCREAASPEAGIHPFEACVIEGMSAWQQSMLSWAASLEVFGEQWKEPS